MKIIHSCPGPDSIHGHEWQCIGKRCRCHALEGIPAWSSLVICQGHYDGTSEDWHTLGKVEPAGETHNHWCDYQLTCPCGHCQCFHHNYGKFVRGHCHDCDCVTWKGIGAFKSDNPQPMPTTGGEDVAPALKERFGKYIDERTERGAKLYGTPLQTNNGRNVGQDMVEEILDFCQYQQQHIMELEAQVSEVGKPNRRLQGFGSPP